MSQTSSRFLMQLANSASLMHSDIVFSVCRDRKFELANDRWSLTTCAQIAFHGKPGDRKNWYEFHRNPSATVQVATVRFSGLLCNGTVQLRINWQLVLRLSIQHALFPSCTIFCDIRECCYIKIQKKLWKLRAVLMSGDFGFVGHRTELDFHSRKILSIRNKVCSFFPFATALDFFLNLQTAATSVFSLSRRLRSRARASSINYQAQNCYTIAIEAADRLNNRRFWTLSFEIEI